MHFLKGGIEASSSTWQATVMIFFLSIAVYPWVDSFASADLNLAKKVKGNLHKISLMAAFLADFPLDTVQCFAKAMATSCVSHRSSGSVVEK